MLGSLLRAFAALPRPSFLWLVIKSLFLTGLIFAGLYAAGLWGADSLISGLLSGPFFGALGTAGEVVLAIGLFVLFLVLYLPVSAIVLGLFVEDAARIVERSAYPQGRWGPRTPGIMESLAVAGRLAVVLLVVNLLALPVYLLLPGVSLILFWSINGYFMGREYFELVAALHVPVADMKGLRRRYSLRLFMAGVLIAFLFTVPLLNFLAPLVAAAFMVHVFQDIGRRAGLFAA